MSVICFVIDTTDTLFKKYVIGARLKLPARRLEEISEPSEILKLIL